MLLSIPRKPQCDGSLGTVAVTNCINGHHGTNHCWVKTLWGRFILLQTTNLQNPT
jgi:hypothetical protein